MYIYDRKPSGSQSPSKEQPITSRRAQRNSYYPDRVVSHFLGPGGTNGGYVWAHEGLGQLTADELSKKLQHLSLLPHFVERNGKDVWLKPSVMNPGIYRGPNDYKIAGTSADPIASPLQRFLEGVFSRNKNLRHIKVALVDLTKDVCKPEFAGFNHKALVSAASVPKIAAMLAAYQLRQDLRVALNKQHKGTKDIQELFKLVRQDWADTQHDHGGRATPFTRGVSLRGKLVLVNGNKIPLGEPNAPRLEDVIAKAKGHPVPIEFNSTGESKAQLETIIDEFNLTKEKEELAKAEQELRVAPSDSIRKAAIRKAKQKLDEALRTKRPRAQEKLNALGFLERVRVMIGGLTPASNFATFTIVRDVGFVYIASTLLQSGLFDTNRKGGLWLGTNFGVGTDFADTAKWRGLAGGKPLATAGSLAAFMTLLVQNKLVSPLASASMRSLMQIEPVNPTHHTTESMFDQGLSALPLKLMLAKIGFDSDGFHECAYIEREVVVEGCKKCLRYVAVGLGAKSKSELEQLIDELDVCILANNRTMPCVEASKRPLKDCPL